MKQVELVRNCPQCNKELFYSRKDILKTANKENRLCIQCCNRQLHEKHYASFPSEFTKEQTNLLLGCLLGDGSLSKADKENSRFSFCQQIQKIERVREIEIKMQPFSSKITIRRASKPKKENGKIKRLKTRFLHRAEIYTCHNPLFTTLRKEWYPNGKKIIPRTLKLNWEIFAHWFQDDGSNNKNRQNKRLRLATHSFTESDVDFLIEILQRDLNVSATKNKSYHQFGIYIRRRDYFKVLENITPFVTSNCMKYKITV
jgi:hypothetical protein